MASCSVLERTQPTVVEFNSPALSAVLVFEPVATSCRCDLHCRALLRYRHVLTQLFLFLKSHIFRRKKRRTALEVSFTFFF